MSDVYVLGIQFQIKLTKISMTKGWSNQEVNTQFGKDTRIPKDTHERQGQIFIERWYIPSRFQIQYNLPKYPGVN